MISIQLLLSLLVFISSTQLIPVVGEWLSQFSDDFSNVNYSSETWGTFDEVVTSCYANVTGTREFTSCQNNLTCVRAWSNPDLLNKSNHLLVNTQYSDSVNETSLFLESKYVRYTLDVLVNKSDFELGQAGPEMSIQITHYDNDIAAWKTRIIGLQSVMNPWLIDANNNNNEPYWNIWTNSDSSSNSASWYNTNFSYPMKSDTWYTIEIIVSFNQSKYINLTIYDKFGKYNNSSDKWTIDLTQYSIIAEDKFSEYGLWFTIEAQNLWTDCVQAIDYSVYYTNVDVSLFDDYNYSYSSINNNTQSISYYNTTNGAKSTDSYDNTYTTTDDDINTVGVNTEETTRIASVGSTDSNDNTYINTTNNDINTITTTITTTDGDGAEQGTTEETTNVSTDLSDEDGNSSVGSRLCVQLSIFAVVIMYGTTAYDLLGTH